MTSKTCYIVEVCPHTYFVEEIGLGHKKSGFSPSKGRENPRYHLISITALKLYNGNPFNLTVISD